MKVTFRNHQTLVFSSGYAFLDILVVRCREQNACSGNDFASTPLEGAVKGGCREIFPRMEDRMKRSYTIFSILGFMTLSLLAPLGSSSSAVAQEAINCLEWTYRTETQYVAKRAANRFAADLIAEGEAFGFYIQSTRDEVDAELGPVRLFALKYDRDSFIDRPAEVTKYSEFTRSLEWHINSRLGHNFYCSFWAPDPHPRLSGSN